MAIKKENWWKIVVIFRCFINCRKCAFFFLLFSIHFQCINRKLRMPFHIRARERENIYKYVPQLVPSRCSRIVLNDFVCLKLVAEKNIENEIKWKFGALNEWGAISIEKVTNTAVQERRKKKQSTICWIHNGLKIYRYWTKRFRALTCGSPTNDKASTFKFALELVAWPKITFSCAFEKVTKW